MRTAIKALGAWSLAATVVFVASVSVADEAPLPADSPTALPERGAVVYLFNAPADDKTGRDQVAAIEKAFRESLAKELDTGRLVLLSIDPVDPQRAGLAGRFEVSGAALILGEVRDGQIGDWKSLPKAFTLSDDDGTLSEYLQYETRAYLRGQWTAFALLMAAALGLGVITSVQPCPMATNIAAVSFIGRRVDSPVKVLLAGLLYALGRATTYVILAVLLIGGLSRSGVESFLHTYLNQILGPILILVGMVLLELIGLNFSGPSISERLQKRVEKWGIWAALLLGVLFALSFCPISAGYFFISLFALLTASNSKVVLPSLYGVGTALPVVGFAVLIAFSAKSVAKAYNALNHFQKWARWITGVVFLVVGIYFTLMYCFGVL